MLTVDKLHSAYGRIEVLHGIDLEVNSGEIVTVVGANGAGKTTLLKCLSGTQPVTGGRIDFRGEAITKVPAFKRLERGLSQSPEGRQIFTNLSVEGKSPPWGLSLSPMSGWPPTWKMPSPCFRFSSRSAI